jgi:UDPglucose 6-dehydrogenase
MTASDQSVGTATDISVIGLGKLGASIAACFAHKGFNVTGADKSAVTVDLINRGLPPVHEPGLGEMLAEARSRVRATQDTKEAVTASDATFIVVPTPSNESGGFSVSHVVDASRAIGQALRGKSGYHLVVLTSTVLPGSTEHAIKSVLEAESGKRCGEDFGLCYSPEFIALGSVIKDFLNPDFLLIGESDERAGDALTEIYRRVVDRMAPVARMNFVNAELAKISVNAYVTMKISFANMLAALCEQLPGGDVDKVTGALALDSRIGPRYLKGAVGYGGPCFPRDNQALAFLARELGYPAPFAEATDAFNRGLLDRLTAKVREHLPEGGTVAVLGLSYKPDTNVVEEAQGLLLAARLEQSGCRVVVFDPVAMDSARKTLGDAVTYAGSLDAAVTAADVIFVTNPDPAFAALDPAQLPKGTVVIDAWRMLRKRAEASGATNYVAVGVARENPDLVRQLAELWTRESDRVAE